MYNERHVYIQSFDEANRNLLLHYSAQKLTHVLILPSHKGQEPASNTLLIDTNTLPLLHQATNHNTHTYRKFAAAALCFLI